MKKIIVYTMSQNFKGWLKNPSNFKAINVMIILFLLLSSCEKVLNEKPKLVAEESFYNTALEVETALNSIYEPLRKLPDAGIIGINSVLDEMCYGRGSWAWLNEYNGLNSTWITRVSNMWGPLYLAIRNANLVIGNVPESSMLTQSQKEQFIGEAKFLRAFAYFQLVKNWGGVPLRTEKNLEITDVPKSTVSELYTLILEDLLYAESNLPDSERLRGTPSKWAAKTVLSDVYLFIEDYDKARDKALEVIDSGRFALVSINTVDDFQKIFGSEAEKNPEEIFYALYSHISGLGNIWPGLLNHPRTGLYGNAGVYGVHGDSENAAYKQWDNNDLRKGQWYSQEFGVRPSTMLSKKLIDPETAGLDGGGNPITWYRYADILMIYSEAETRTNGVTEKALEALNKVHRRAYGFDPNNGSEVDFKAADFSDDTFIDQIVKEKGYEFQLEGKRWPDLKRLGLANEIIQKIWGKSVPEKNLLWPIPVNEFNFNLALDPLIDQNPGY